MKNLVLDIGNSSIKWALFEGGEIVSHGRSFKDAGKTIEEITSVHSIGQIVISSVKSLESLKFSRTLIVDKSTPMPLKLNYQTPETLGVDRLVAAVGANDRFPNGNVLIVDVGSCMTIDLITDGTFQGGAISPGLEMRFKAMNKWTDKLPLLSIDLEKINFPGKSTEACMLSGVVYGMLDEISGAISRYENQFGDLKILLTGGDSYIFESRLKNDIFADSLLVLKGLHGILSYNSKNI